MEPFSEPEKLEFSKAMSALAVQQDKHYTCPFFIDDTRASELAEAVRKNPNIKELRVDYYRVSIAGEMKMSEMLAARPDVDLQGMHIQKALRKDSLRRLRGQQQQQEGGFTAADAARKATNPKGWGHDV